MVRSNELSNAFQASSLSFLLVVSETVQPSNPDSSFGFR